MSRNEWRDPWLVDWGCSPGPVELRFPSGLVVAGELDLEEVNVNEPPLATFTISGATIDRDHIEAWRPMSAHQ